ncbi:hypothetical protein XA68_17079 [Ophiocordyceps unilateralis]|uniref:PARP-type domain-containing protein n=1 Tax=Ophiocordyceps unilateralis TaxID=268505 RepID=A0A2A9P4I0_OPHUN|nr:hypothetical protein XA68_17079 [Ophiocordyceps unilateralis]
MPQYRIEVSPNNRAVCKDTVCKANQEKITKGEIRFGSWVEVKEHGSWSWKHWGCVSGAQMVAVQELCDSGDGKYDFDAIDGYDELSDHADIREKISRCIQQGHVDAEDFKGDPEKNKPGEKGIRLTPKQKAAKEQAAREEAGEDSDEELVPKKKAAKRGRSKKVEVDEDDEPLVKKAKTSKAVKPVKASRGKPPSAKKAAEDDGTDADATEEEAPKAKSKAAERPKSRAKAEADGEDTTRRSSRRAKVAAPKPSIDEDDDEDELAAETDDEPPAKSKRGGKTKAPAAKVRRGRPRRRE